jgi:hypothetical protein
MGKCKNDTIDTIHWKTQGGTMPEFEIVDLRAAQSQGKYLSEYSAYIQQIPQGQAGKLRLLEQENPTTIRKRLGVAAQALGVTLVIKRSGQDLYFWIEQPVKPAAAERAQRRRGRRPRREEETAPAEQPFIEPEFPGSDTIPEMVAPIEPER